MMNRRTFSLSTAVLALAAHSGASQGAKQNSGGQVMLEKVVYVTIFVKDQDKALGFYTNVLGFEKRADVPKPNAPRFVAVGLKGQDLLRRVLSVLWMAQHAQGEAIHAVLHGTQHPFRGFAVSGCGGPHPRDQFFPRCARVVAHTLIRGPARQVCDQI